MMTEGVDWAAIVDETTADDINKEEKAKPKEDETDKPETADKGKSIVDLQQTLNDSAKDKKIIEKADIEKKAAEKFASSMVGADSEAASEEVTVIQTNKKLESTIGQALS